LWPGWAIAAAGLAVADRRNWRTAAPAAFSGFWLAYLFWPSGGGSGATSTAAILPLAASYLIFLAHPVWSARQRGRSSGPIDLCLTALNAGFFFGAGYGVLHAAGTGLEGLFAVTAASAQMAAARLLWKRDEHASLLAAGAAWLLLVVAVPVQFAGYRVTIAWALEGAALAWIGLRAGTQRAVTASLAVFLLAVLRLGFADSGMYTAASEYGLLGNARFFSFAVSAASLWAAAWWIRQDWRALACYLTGHTVMLWGLGLETAGWVARNTPPQNLTSAASMALSVLGGGYAVGLVAAGAARKHGVTRMAGAVLIGAVVSKLYLYDVWLLSQFYRMTAFAILGTLLLVVSCLYSHFRGSLGNWWRP
jgi:hypothetical protein